MIDAVDLEDGGCYAVTDGEIALVNLDGARRRSWHRLAMDPFAAGAAERTVEEEQMTLQFRGDAGALDRLDMVTTYLAQTDPDSARTALVAAQVASTAHRFADARHHLAQAERAGAARDGVERLSLTIDQACGERLDEILAARRRAAARSGSLEDLVPLGALLADLRQSEDADNTYRRALAAYHDVSPFGPAWTCFQLGVLWGELVEEPQTTRAAHWYRRAIAYVPAYTKARVHLAEIRLHDGNVNEAEALLTAALPSGDPEVRWRLGDVFAAQGRFAEAEEHLAAARFAFEALLDRHPLAFADHGAEFFAGSGNDVQRALDLARVNVANRPTLRAYELAHDIAVDAGAADAASHLMAEAALRWGATDAFRRSALASQHGGTTATGVT